MTDVELVKSKIEIVDFISEYIKLKRSGRTFKTLCPFHSEKTPSFYVSPERQSWHCFGACNIGGDVISFLQKWENIEFYEALKILAEKVGVKLSGYAPSEKTQVKEKLYAINNLASEFFHYLLTAHRLGERARIYLKKRKIRQETIKTFNLGYSPNSWDSLMKFLIKKRYTVSDLLEAGLLVRSEEGSFYDRFRGRLIFTLKDHRGNIVGFSGRSLEEEVKGAKYINTPETPIYIKGGTLYGLDVAKEAIKKENCAVLVEGEFDMLSSFQAGVGNVVAIKGSALTEGQVSLLKRFTENLTLSLDSDFAGNEAARRGIEIAENANLLVKVVKLIFGKDPAECIEKDPHLWKQAIKDALPIHDFIIGNAFEKYGQEGVIGKKKIASEVVPFLAKIQNPIILSHYTKEFSRKLEVTEESVEIAIRQFQKKQQTGMVLPIQKEAQSREMVLEEYLLSLVIQSENVQDSFRKVFSIISFDDFDTPSLKKIFETLAAFLSTHKKFSVRGFVENLPIELTPIFDKAYLKDIEKILGDEEKYKKELGTCAKEVKKLSLRRRVNSISTKIKKTEEEEGEETEALQKELQKVIRELREIDKDRK
jgi:DNA primase